MWVYLVFLTAGSAEFVCSSWLLHERTNWAFVSIYNRLEYVVFRCILDVHIIVQFHKVCYDSALVTFVIEQSSNHGFDRLVNGVVKNVWFWILVEGDFLTVTRRLAVLEWLTFYILLFNHYIFFNRHFYCLVVVGFLYGFCGCRCRVPRLDCHRREIFWWRLLLPDGCDLLSSCLGSRMKRSFEPVKSLPLR